MFTDRVNQELIFQSFTNKFITVVLGSRRIGKSFLVEEYIKRHNSRSWVLLNMDKLVEREAVKLGNLRQIIEESAEQAIGQDQKLWVVIDEAQKCPELFDQIKILYDEFKDKDSIKIILTGSGYLYLHQLSAETLAGRVELFYLREFSLRETLNLQLQKTMPTPLTLSWSCDQDNLYLLEKHILAIAPLRRRITERTES